MAQSLNQVQKKLISETVRPGIEKMIQISRYLDGLAMELSNQQYPIANNDEVLNDGNGDNPREDAPSLTGADIANLLTYANNMQSQISASIPSLVSKSVRSVNDITRGI